MPWGNWNLNISSTCPQASWMACQPFLLFAVRLVQWQASVGYLVSLKTNALSAAVNFAEQPGWTGVAWSRIYCRLIVCLIDRGKEWLTCLIDGLIDGLWFAILDNLRDYDLELENPTHPMDAWWTHPMVPHNWANIQPSIVKTANWAVLGREKERKKRDNV